MDSECRSDDTCESRLYVGNLDCRITESCMIKMFSPFGKIVSEDFLWHTRGPKRGEPRGYAFIQYSTKEEAQLAKAKMDGRMACGRPLVVRFAGEKNSTGATYVTGATGISKKSGTACGSSSTGQMSRTAAIAAIKNKLKSLEEDGFRAKKSKLTSDNACNPLDGGSSAS